LKELLRSILIFVVMSLVTGLAYPYVVTEIAHMIAPERAKGSLMESNGKIIGSALIGQNFSSPRYFHGRPSALDKPYDASNSGGSNLGPSNIKSLELIATRVEKTRKENGLADNASVPPDMVLASASGLDPHISIETAILQATRVARIRGLPEETVLKTIERVAEKQYFGNATMINVLKLNMAVDALMEKN
jgi:potassium-transporting ATPase KdpC subunit